MVCGRGLARAQRGRRRQQCLASLDAGDRRNGAPRPGPALLVVTSHANHIALAVLSSTPHSTRRAHSPLYCKRAFPATTLFSHHHHTLARAMAWLLDRVRRRAAGPTPSRRPAVVACASSVATAPATTNTATTANNNASPSDAARATLIGDAQEVAGPLPLPSSAVQGRIPSWLRGSLVANGGGMYGGMDHLFDGLASVARVGINEKSGGNDGGGSAAAAPAPTTTFSQRMIKTRAYERKQATGKVAYREFATAPPIDPPGSLAAEARALFGQLAQLASGKPEFTDNASVNLIPVQLPVAAGAAATAGAAANNTTPTTTTMLLAVSETPGASYLLDARTLETVRDAAPDATGASDGVPGMLTTAHPARLPGSPTGELVNFTRTLPFGGMHLYRMDTRGEKALKRRPFAFIPDRRPMSPTWVHDFAVAPALASAGDGNTATKTHYAVIVEPPIYMNLGSLMLGGDRGDPARGKRGLGASDYVFMDWKPEDGVRVTVTPLAAAAEEQGGGNDNNKSSKKPTTTDTIHFLVPQSFFVFHFGNCFVSRTDASTGQALELCADLAAYDDPAILNDLRLAPLRSGPTPLGDKRGGHGPGGRNGEVSKSYYARLTIPLELAGKDDGKGGKWGTASSPIPLSSPKPLARDDQPHMAFAEFPCVAPKWRGRADSRYTYLMNAVRPTNMGNALCKLDLKTGESKTWHEPGAAPGEPVFVARPGAEDEDDGVVLAFLAAAEGGSCMVVLDAKEWKEIARVRLPVGVQYRFHGCFVPEI